MATFAISRLYSTLRTNNCQAIQHVWEHKMKQWAHACNALYCLFWIRSRAWVTLCIYNRSGFSALQKNLWKCWERVHVCAYADQAFQLCGKLIRYSDLVYLIPTNVQHTFCLNACMHTWCRAQDRKQYVEIYVHHLSIFILGASLIAWHRDDVMNTFGLPNRRMLHKSQDEVFVGSKIA